MPSWTMLVAAALACLLGACHRDPVSAGMASAAAPVTHVAIDAEGNTLPDSTIAPARGGGFSVTLPGHATQGYAWSLAPGFDARVVAPKGAMRYGALPANALMGASAAEIFDFTAVGSGTTRLTFTLARPWEGPGRAAETRSFSVVVP